MQSPVAESRPLPGQLAQPGSQRRIVSLSGPVAPAPSVHPDQPTGVPLAQPRFLPYDTHCFSLGLRAYHFFDSTTFSASRSSACWATILFSRPFSSSSCRSRLASFTSRPPYFAFVASLTPSRRHSSFTGTPASASFNTPTICSSLNRLFLMACSSRVVLPQRSYISVGLVFGGQVNPRFGDADVKFTAVRICKCGYCFCQFGRLYFFCLQ